MQLTGLMGIEGFTVDNPEAGAEEIHGKPVNPAHSQWGEVSEPYPWQMTQYGSTFHGPYGPENGLLEDELDGTAALAAGVVSDDPTGDTTPYYGHASPWPKDPAGDLSVSPDNIIRQRMQNLAIQRSAVEFGASRKRLYEPTMEANNDVWRSAESVTPGTSLEPHGVPAQVGIAVGGWGSTDPVQNPMNRRNSFGFDSAHLHRRWAAGSIPGNFMWMKPGSRPMVRSMTGVRHFPTGSDSPFEGDDVTVAYGLHGAILTEAPSEYVPPPQPTVQPATYGEDGGSMDTSWGGW
jgi:hypothetical protein